MDRILKSYLKRLTNLSSRNKSLLLGRLHAEQFADLHEADFLLSHASFDLLQFVIQRRSRVALCDVRDPRYEKVNLLSRRLRKIARTQRFIEEESGAQDLYLGYPFVRGKFADGTPVHAPLLFFPVGLRADREQWCLYPREETGVRLNRSFALAYGHFNETLIPDRVLETAFEEFPANATMFRTELYKWLNDSPFRINFNPQLFEDKLQPFHALTGADLELLEKSGELKLYPEAVLGIFPVAGSYLEPDYRAMLGDEQGHPLLSVADDRPGGEAPAEAADDRTVVRLKEEHILLPFMADASQENVIRAVKEGASVVVQGPPGTGKSQLICNLMADFAAQGKRVLLVCQKRAALDVVHQRLCGEGLGSFLALIHDFRNDRGNLYRQLADQIEKVEAYKKMNYSLDAVVFEREFTRVSRRIDQISDELTGFRKALFDEEACGMSVKELYLRSSPGRPHVQLRSHYRMLRPDREHDFRRRLLSYIRYARLLQDNHPWEKRVSFAGFSGREEELIRQSLERWPSFYREQVEAFSAWTGFPFSPVFVQNRSVHAGCLEALERRELTVLALQLYRALALRPDRIDELSPLADHAVQRLSEWDGLESSLQAAEIPGFQQKLRNAEAARQSLVKGWIWEWFSPDKTRVAEVAALHELGISAADLRRLGRLLERRTEAEEWLRHPDLDSLPPLPQEGGPLQQRLLHYFQALREAVSLVVLLRQAGSWQPVLHQLLVRAAAPAEVHRVVAGLRGWLLHWEKRFSEMAPCFLEVQLNGLVEDPGLAAVFREALGRDFDSMAEMDGLWEEFADSEKEVVALILDKGREEGMEHPEEFGQLYENSLFLAWIQHIEAAHPELRAVSSLKMKEWEDQLQLGIVRKQELSRDILLMRLREFVFRDIEKNRLGNTVTYRELYHQVTKKRKIWPVRKLVEQFPGEIFSLVPCWMASPESVSAMFPMQKGLFDLVIFDEASQCFAEYGLPAAFRARQVVVTGDSQQLRPGDLYKIRFGETSEEEAPLPALEAESLLDLASQSLEPYRLTGHYRSLSPDLIDFSNRHFYKGALRLLPDFDYLNRKEPGISYLKVEGRWKDQVNEAEAEQVLELLGRLDGQGKSVGVVTFNYPQQQLIQEMVEKHRCALPGLFVKNIENVQGDERDVVIFSTGYAPDESGKLAMRFGSLNTEGGANRLNVAVTRARQHVYVVTSLWPEQLRTDGAVHSGPGLLRSYLQYALDVSRGAYQPSLTEVSGYRTTWMLKDRLISENAGYSRLLPFADITVEGPDGYEGLVFTDDDLYHESPLAKEPHAYLPLALMEKNWAFSRVYSRNYWLGRG